MKFVANHDLQVAVHELGEAGKQTRFAAAVALTRTVGDMRAGIRKGMQRSFDRPTPYTLNSMFIKGATPASLEATVWVKDNPFGSGTPADRYLKPEILGGVRPQKNYERMLQRIGVLPAGWQTVPGAGAQIDAFGNMSRGQITRVLSWFRAFSEQGYAKNSTDKTRARIKRGSRKAMGIEYFVSKGKGTRLPNGRLQHLPAGIYARTNQMFGGVSPILLFVQSVWYQPRLHFFITGKRIADEVFPRHLDREFKAAVRMAK